MKKNIIFSIIISLTLVLSAHAQSTSAPTIEELQKQIQLLLSQVGSLQKEVTSLKSPAPNVATPTTISTTPPPSTPQPFKEIEDESEVSGTEIAFIPPPILTRSLLRGSRGEDVKQLQEFLAQDPTIYPEGLTSGYYGIGTESAVKRWQAKNGVPAVGIVGRQTIAKFKTFVEIYSPLRPTTPDTDLPIKPKITDPGKNVCTAYSPATCPAGEERYVVSNSTSCTIYACKPHEINRADNTIATLKKVSSIQTDNRYNLILNDPEGIQKFSIYNSKGAEINSSYPACRKEWSSPVISVDATEFPLKLSLSDCASGQYNTILSTSVVVKPIVEGLTFPYTFSNGKVVNSSDEARSYCYVNGPGSGSGQSVAAECETKFGVVYTSVTPITSDRAVYLSDAFSSCMSRNGFLADAKQIKVWAQSTEPIPWSVLTSASQNSVQTCEKEYYGQGTVETGAAMCADGKDNDGDGFIDLADPSCSYTIAPLTGQKEQVWNSLGLKSWVKADADSARITQLKSVCASVPNSSNIWTANAGNYSSADFGMPDTTKCQKASSCTAGQYFDGMACVTTTTPSTYACSDGRDNDGDSLIDYPADTGCYSKEDTSEDIPTTTTSCSQYGTGWHIMGSDGNCFDTYMTNYRTANGTLYSCSTTPATGCTNSSSTACTSGQYWNGTACVTSTTSTSCPSGQYWSGSACVTSTTTTTTSTGSCSQYGDGWHVMGDNNCYNSGMTEYRTANGTLYSCSTTPSSGCTSSSTTGSTSCGSGGYYWNGSSCVSSCASGQYWSGTACITSSTTSTSCPSGQWWNGSVCVSSTTTTTSTSCPSGQYWSGSACVNTSTTDCTSGQYWNGTACVSSTPSASAYDQMRDQLKAMEIILRGLLGR
ncbi:MAG: peptidoglycan-binding domain-containing protein [bacterium]|nr:peptidoglycan-binding domain-containing protein [bacterium]